MHIYPKRASLLLDGLGNEILKLVSYGATPEQWAEWLRVPLEHAAARGNLDLVNNLISAGADGSAGYRGCRGRTLLDAAAVGGSADVVTALLEAGAQPDVGVVSVSPRRSALFAATVCGHEEAALRLVRAGADVGFDDPVEQGSVLHLAAAGGHERLVGELLVGGADPNSVAKANGGTPLHQAVGAGRVGIVSRLLLGGSSKDALDKNGHSLLVWAAYCGHLEVANVLLEAGVDPGARGGSGGFGPSALDVAISFGHVPVLRAILGRGGVDVNHRHRSGSTPLYEAVMKGQVEAIDALVDAGADTESKTFLGQTVLHTAAFYRKVPSVLALLKRGAAVDSRDKYGETPLHMACSRRRPGVEAVVDLLLRWGADEKALGRRGLAPADMLSSAPVYFVPGAPRQCSQEEIERARLLLARAPADRAWRRRCWLIMLRRRRASEAAAAAAAAAAVVAVDSNSGGGGGSGRPIAAAADGRAGDSCKVARTGNAVGIGTALHSSRGRTNNGGRGGVEAGGAETDGGNDLSGLVGQLLGLELEGVFRTVVAFL